MPGRGPLRLLYFALGHIVVGHSWNVPTMRHSVARYARGAMTRRYRGAVAITGSG